MANYHHWTADIGVWNSVRKEKLYLIFRDLLSFYGKTAFDDGKTAFDDGKTKEDTRIVLTSTSEGTQCQHHLVHVDARGIASDDIVDVLIVTSKRLSKCKRFGITGGVFVLTNVDTLKKTRIAYGITHQERLNAILKSSLNEFMDSVDGALSFTRNEDLRIAITDACAKATTPRRQSVVDRRAHP